MNEDRLLNVKQVAELLSCCVANVWKGVREGMLPKPVKYGNYTRWNWSEIQQFIAGLQSGKNPT